MTECIGKPLNFTAVGGRPIAADFSGGTITSDGGALLLREADRQLGLIRALDAALPDPRSPKLLLHPQQTMLAQRIFGIACGYEDLNDHDQLRHDPLWQNLTDHPTTDAALASSPTLCRLENRVDRTSLWRMAAALVDCFIASHATPPDELLLDFDATDDAVHGHQENRFFHGYYDHYCFLPLYVYAGDRLLAAYLRPANIDGAYQAKAILKLLVDRLRAAWPNVRIAIRADSGFCRWRMLRWCDSHDIRYVVGLARNSVLEAELAPLSERVCEQFQSDGQAHREFTEFCYKAGTWNRAR